LTTPKQLKLIIKVSEHSNLHDLLIEIGLLIEDGDHRSWWVKEMAKMPEWQGADVIITSDFEARSHGFLDHDLVVRSRHASAITWLFFRLRDAFGEELDASNKYRFFGDLAKAALAVSALSPIEANDARPLLKAILREAIKYYRELRESDFIAEGSNFVLHMQDEEGRQKRIDLETGEETA